MGKRFVGCVSLKDVMPKEGIKMKKLIAASFLVIMVAFSTGQVLATKPGEDVNPNGFPSGEHFNLNIIGKKDSFACPEQEYDQETGEPIYGNVIFVPELGPKNGDPPIEILMQSGKHNGKGSKNTALPDVLQVIDPCTAAFDGDAAVLQLPKNEGGYRVYARALAKPTDNPDMTITPGLVAVEDEYENDLVYLGLVTDNGFETPYEIFTRKKGKSRAVDITGLFLWSGIVYYLSPPADGYQYEQWVCGIDTDGDGVIDEYVIDDTKGTPILTYANAYTDEWVFSIGDFVEYLWDVNNNGLKLLQIRFYPNNGGAVSQAPGRPQTPDLKNTNLTTTWGDIKSDG
jgi:hypothetical protein